MSFDDDPSAGRVAPNDTGDLIDLIHAVAREIGSVELKVDAWQIDRNTAAGLTGIDVAPSELFDERAVLVDLHTLLVDRPLLFFLPVFLSLQLVADQGSRA